jgi:hypothetical protein
LALDLASGAQVCGQLGELGVGLGGVKEVDALRMFVRGDPAVGQCLAEQVGYAFAIGVRRSQLQLGPVIS